MRKVFLLLAAPLALMGCTTDGGDPISSAGSNFAEVTRAPLAFAFNSFDAALFGFDFAMDAKIIPAGSERAKAIAAAGRKVLAFLKAAEAARDAGSATSYNQAFDNATNALKEFQTLLGPRARAQLDLPGIRLTPENREYVLNRAAA